MNAEEILHEEFKQDPLGRGYASMSIDERVLDVNIPSRSVVKPLLSGALREWAAANERAHWIRNAVDNATDRNGDAIAPSAISVAIIADSLISVSNASVDLSKQDHIDLLLVLVSAGVLTDDDADSLESLATYFMSRATELTGAEATQGDVARASV